MIEAAVFILSADLPTRPISQRPPGMRRRGPPPAYRRPPNAASILRSVLYWLNAYTDQIAAGSQPMIVICSSRQMIPAIGRPIVKNWNHGNSRASKGASGISGGRR